MPKRNLKRKPRERKPPSTSLPAKVGRGGARPGAGNHHRIAAGVHSLKNEVLTLRSKWGVMPLDYMLSVLNNLKETTARREWAASNAAPYLHHKLASIEITDASAGPLKHEVDLSKLSTQEVEVLGELVNKATISPEVTLDGTQYHEVED